MLLSRRRFTHFSKLSYLVEECLMNLLGSVSIKSTDLAGFFVGIGQEILMLLLQVRTMVKMEEEENIKMEGIGS